MGTVNTKKFGEVNYEESEVIEIHDGILGFETNTKFIAIEQETSRPFIWLQSVQDAKISFVAINPYMFYKDYKIQIQKSDQELLNIEAIEDLYVLTLVVVPSDNPENISTNLLAPLIINRKNNTARQIILHNSGYNTKHFLKSQLMETKTQKQQVA